MRSEVYGSEALDCIIEGVSDVAGSAAALTEAACCIALFAALRLFLDASGSLMNMHSLPLDEHLEQGYCRLHLTFDSAHASR